jgi:hypothetical protein
MIENYVLRVVCAILLITIFISFSTIIIFVIRDTEQTILIDDLNRQTIECYAMRYGN